MGVPCNHPAILRALERGLIRAADLEPWAPAPAPAVTGTTAGLLVPPATDCSEKVFQSKVMALANEHGYECYHTHDSRRSAKGFPDLVLCKPGVLIFAELKSAKGKFRPEQVKWLDLLATVPGVRVFRWRPIDWPDVVEVLTASSPEPV